MKFLCIYEGENPSAAIVNENKIEMFIEEERLNRVKHSSNIFPIRAIQRVLKDCNLKLNGIDGICIPWDLDAYEQSKEVQTHYELVNKEFPPDSGT
jgi:predicted NodU family carbamoyl transferase